MSRKRLYSSREEAKSPVEKMKDAEMRSPPSRNLSFNQESNFGSKTLYWALYVHVSLCSHDIFEMNSLLLNLDLETEAQRVKQPEQSQRARKLRIWDLKPGLAHFKAHECSF